jgi:hypothetical protein
MKIEFRFKTDEQSEQFCTEIVMFMKETFNISLEEALGRLNKHWSNITERIGEDQMIYHETIEFWGYDIYYGPVSRWWAREDDPTLKPLPYP